MSGSRIPPDVHLLLSRQVDSFEKLEILVALDGTPDKQMLRTVLADKLQARADVMKQSVAELEASGLIVVADDVLRLDVSGDTRSLAALLGLCAEDRIAVMSALSTIAMNRIRGLAAGALADAFDVRKKPKRDDDG